jgi:hypothetical protein
MNEKYKPISCQHEGSFPGLETVLFSFIDPYTLIHHKTERCAIEYPHHINECKEFSKPELK